MARLIVSHEAQSDISEILSFLRLEAGATVALEYSDGFEKKRRISSPNSLA